MPRKKTKSRSSKPKQKLKEKSNGIEELLGFKIGDFIYCFRYPDKVLCRGFIKKLFDVEGNQFAEFVDEITGQFRISLLSEIIENPTRSQINSANSKIAFKVRKSKEKTKK